jgi:hypothetical protein
MKRHIFLILISIFQIFWIFVGYMLRVTQKRFEIFQSDQIVFLVPFILALLLFVFVFFRFYFLDFSKSKRITISVILGIACAFFSFWIAMLLGLNLYGS